MRCRVVWQRWPAAWRKSGEYRSGCRLRSGWVAACGGFSGAMFGQRGADATLWKRRNVLNRELFHEVSRTAGCLPVGDRISIARMPPRRQTAAFSCWQRWENDDVFRRGVHWKPSRSMSFLTGFRVLIPPVPSEGSADGYRARHAASGRRSLLSDLRSAIDVRHSVKRWWSC